MTNTPRNPNEGPWGPYKKRSKLWPKVKLKFQEAAFFACACAATGVYVAVAAHFISPFAAFIGLAHVSFFPSLLKCIGWGAVTGVGLYVAVDFFGPLFRKPPNPPKGPGF